MEAMDSMTTQQQGRTSRFRPHPFRLRDPNREAQQHLGRQDRIALRITRAVGTMYAVYVIAVFMAGWMLLEVAAGGTAFDPYPFAFLLFLGNVVQLSLMPLIMVGQNLQGRHAEIRADVQFDTVTKTFSDLESVLAHLDAQDQEAMRHSHLLRALVEQLLPPERAKAMLADAADQAARSTKGN